MSILSIKFLETVSFSISSFIFLQSWHIFLARRRELLAAAGVIFQVCAADGEEKITSDKPEEIVRELSEQKATAVALNFDMEEGTVVIGADTIVSYNNEILGKPVDESDAFKTLKMLQGNIHQVYTGVTVLIKKNGKWENISFSESTDVSFLPGLR